MKKSRIQQFYCYIYYRKNKTTPFYVGKGKGNRAYKLNDHNIWVRNIVEKDGKENINIEIIKCNDEKSAFNLEIRWIAIFKSDGYILCNKTDGGDGVSGYKQSEEHKSKISKAHKGKKLSEEHKAKLSISGKGYGQALSEETKLKISKANKGKKRSEETKRKISEIKKKEKRRPRKCSEQEKIRLKNLRKGSKASEETKLKLSKSKKEKNKVKKDKESYEISQR